MGMAASRKWRLHHKGPTPSIEFDEIVIIFHIESGKTHFLNETSARILKLVGETPFTLAGICRRLFEESSSQLGASQIRQVGHHMDRLEALGLIEPC